MSALPGGLIDPALADGFRVVYDREVTVERRRAEDNDARQGVLVSIKARVLVTGEDRLQMVRVELSDDNDLYFHLVTSLDKLAFDDVQAKQRLMAEFQDFPGVLIKCLNSCKNNPQSCMAVLYTNDEGAARMDFVQNLEYKFVELLSVNFMESPPELVKMHITYRYAMMKASRDMLQTRLHDLSELVKSKNPSLLLQASNAAAQQSSSSNDQQQPAGLLKGPTPKKGGRKKQSARKKKRTPLPHSMRSH